MTDALWASFSNAWRAGGEAATILDVCGELFSENTALPFAAALETEEVEFWEGNDDPWVYPYCVKSWRLKSRTRSKIAGFITVATSFFRPEDELGGDWEGAKRAKLYVGYTPPPRRNPAWDAGNLLVDAAGQAPEARPAGAFLWQANGGLGEAAWFFCVKLLEIEGRDDLVREVVQPVGRLVAGAADPFSECRSTIRCPRETIE